MIVLSVSQMTTLRWDLDQELQYLDRSNWGGLGLYRNKVQDQVGEPTLRCIAGQLHERGLVPTSYSWIGGFTGSDPWGYDEAVATGMRMIAEASEAGVPVLSVLAGGRNGHTWNHANRMLLTALRRLSRVADRFDVELALQPIHPGCGPQWSFIESLQRAVDVVRQVSHDRLGIAVDSYQIGFGDQWRQLLPEVARYIKILQLSDGSSAPKGEVNRCPLGDGLIPVDEILKTSLDSGYEGAVEVLIHGRGHCESLYEDVLDRAYEYACEAVRQVGVAVR